MATKLNRKMALLAGLLACATACAGASADEAKYEIGGPLAGLKLPLFPTQYGEPAGFPGCLREVDAQGNTVKWIHAPQVITPELQLYPGSVEHFRATNFKHTPIRSFFDAQSMLKNFQAADLPGVRKDQVESYAEPVYWLQRDSGADFVGKYLAPVPVVRCKVKDPVFKLDLGELDAGLYAVRVIGAVETKSLRPFMWPLYLKMRVNDGLGGETSEYRIRIAYNDEFYGVAEIYFHAPEKRRYAAELFADDGSAVDLLVHNITLDDVLAGTVREPVKAQRVSLGEGHTNYAHFPKGYLPQRPPLSPEARLARDAAIWNAAPPVNKYPYRGIDADEDLDHAPGWGKTFQNGAAGKPIAQIDAEQGQWEYVPLLPFNTRESEAGVFPASTADMDKLLVNNKLHLTYTMSDLVAGKPLPAPFPYPDDGAGLFYPDPANPDGGMVYWRVAGAVWGRWDEYIRCAESPYFLSVDNPDVTRDRAIALLRFAYEFPTMDEKRCANWLTHDPACYGKSPLRYYWPSGGIYGNFIRFLDPVYAYDDLFDYIKGNEDLAKSVSRFVPWVKTSKDLRQLLDVYLVQTMAKHILRYQYVGDGREPQRIAELATVADNTAVTDPWMDWLFARVFFYPNPIAGVQDIMITGTDRDGRSPIGSFSYMEGEFSAARAALMIEQYLDHGGNPRFDLRNNTLYPKTILSTQFLIPIRVAGLYTPRIGDVSGPSAIYGQWFDSIQPEIDCGWRWTKDPRFAYILFHYFPRAGYTDAQWAEIEQAAAKQPRAPWMENRSRVLSGWDAILESGVQYDDFRFRTAAVVRVNRGWGHEHFDILDLELYAHGLPMMLDGGQRGEGYCKPPDRTTRVHNTVEVNGQDWWGYSWVRTLSDMEGARYLCAQAEPKNGARLFRRQTALIDAAEGSGAEALTAEQCGPHPQGLPMNVVTPDSYLFDVFRVAGGDQHTYCFHAAVNDPHGPAQPQTNALGVHPIPPEGQAISDPAVGRAAAYLNLFSNEKYCGIAPAEFDATFHLEKLRAQPGTKSDPQCGTEESYLKPFGLYDPQSPDKFVKLHLLDAAGLAVMKGDSVCRMGDYNIPIVFVQRNGTNLESAFPAIIEPYVGKPFILETKLVEIPENESDARRAVAVAVKTANGRSDVCFADGRPERQRQAGDLKVAAEFAYLSTDAAGLRCAALTGGTLLSGPEVRLETAARERKAKIVKCDYLAKTFWINQAWPAHQGAQTLEIGSLPEDDETQYVASYPAASVQPAEGGSAITLSEGADCYRSRIESFDEKEGVVSCTLDPVCALGDYTRGWAASNEARTKFWRASRLGGGKFKLEGGATRADFAPDDSMRLWEYGVGDTVRHSTFAILRRLDNGVFELQADVACAIGLPADSLQVSSDGKTFAPATGEKRGNLFVLRVSEKDLGAAGKVWIRK